MAYWKNIGVVIVGTIFTSIFSGSTINNILSIYYQPSLNAEILSYNSLYDIIHITNHGNAAAKNLRITIEWPPNIHILRFFSSENYYKIPTNSSTLEMYLSRVIQGEG